MNCEQYKQKCILEAETKKLQVKQESLEKQKRFLSKVKETFPVEKEFINEFGFLSVLIANIEFSVAEDYIHFSGPIKGLRVDMFFPDHLYMKKIRNTLELGEFFVSYEQILRDIKFLNDLDEKYKNKPEISSTKKSFFERFFYD